MARIQLLLVFFLFLYVFSCDSTASRLEGFHKNLEQRMTKEELLLFKNAPIDSIPYVFGLFSEEYIEAMQEEVISNEDLMVYLEQLGVHSVDMPDYMFLVYSFHGWLNGEAYSLSDCQHFYALAEKRKEDEQNRLDEEEAQIIHSNWTQYELGDTLLLIFPVTLDRLPREVFIRMYPYSLDIYEFEDTLKLNAVLIGKLNDKCEFQLVITAVSKDSILLMRNLLFVGDTIDFPVGLYSRPME